MGKLSECFKGCWKQSSIRENSTFEQDGPSQSQQDGSEDRPTDPDEENSQRITMKDAYSAIIAEAERIWEDDVNCAVLRETSDRSMLTLQLDSYGSPICPDRKISVGEQILR